MGVKLMVEVLDHYHGPHKLWLVGFAEQANEVTRVGWPKRDLLARRADVTVWHSSHIAAELVAAKVIKRPDWEPDENRDKRRAAYVLLPLAGSGAARKGAADSTKDGAADRTEPGEIGAADSTEPGEIGAVFGEVGAVFKEVGAIDPPVSARQTANPPSPQSPQSPHKKPSRRTTRNRSRGKPAATDDDDLDSLLDKLGATEPQREYIRSLARTGSNAEYLRQQIESDGGEAFMRYVRRVMAEADAEPGGRDGEGEEYPF